MNPQNFLQGRASMLSDRLAETAVAKLQIRSLQRLNQLRLTLVCYSHDDWNNAIEALQPSAP